MNIYYDIPEKQQNLKTNKVFGLKLLIKNQKGEDFIKT